VPTPARRPATGGDVGTLDSYYDAHMDLLRCRAGIQPVQQRVADSHPHPAAPAGRSSCTRNGGSASAMRSNSVVSNGVIVSGALVRESVLSPGRADRGTTPSWNAQ